MVVDFLFTLCKIFYHILLSVVKSVLPNGFLPRKSVMNEVVLITGAGNGIGRLMAIEFAKLGSRVVLWDINENGNTDTKEIIESIGAKAYAYTVDLSDRQAIYETAKRVKVEIGDVNILINNAGIVTGKKIFDCPDALMEKTMAVNSNALFWTAKAFVPKMLETNHGHIVTIASMAGHTGVTGLADYCASKHAAVGFNESLRAEIHTLNKDVIVTTVNPHYINTGMFNGVSTHSNYMFPLLDPNFVVECIMEAVLTNIEDLYIPKSSNLYVFLKGTLPTKAMKVVEDFFEVNKTMDHFVGRKLA